MIQTILVAVDGSANARQAVELASDLATKLEARLVLLHVCFGRGTVPERLRHTAEARLAGLSQKSSQVKDTTGTFQAPAALGGEFFLAPPASPEVIELVGKMVLEEAKGIAARKAIGRVLEVMAEDGGDTAEHILDCAKREAADLIVMGSRGFGELQGLVLGSTSHKVNQLSECPCFTVRRRGARSISSFTGIERLLVATDGSKQADAAVVLAADIAALYESHLILLQVLLPEKSAEELRHGLEGSRRLCEERGVKDVSLDLVEGDPAERILRYAEEENVDLIVIGRRGLGYLEGLLLGSVSSKVCHQAKCTTVSVH